MIKESGQSKTDTLEWTQREAKSSYLGMNILLRPEYLVVCEVYVWKDT